MYFKILSTGIKVGQWSHPKETNKKSIISESGALHDMIQISLAESTKIDLEPFSL